MDSARFKSDVFTQFDTKNLFDWFDSIRRLCQTLTDHFVSLVSHYPTNWDEVFFVYKNKYFTQQPTNIDFKITNNNNAHFRNQRQGFGIQTERTLVVVNQNDFFSSSSFHYVD